MRVTTLFSVGLAIPIILAAADSSAEQSPDSQAGAEDGDVIAAINGVDISKRKVPHG